MSARREVLAGAGAGAMALLGLTGRAWAAEGQARYGLIGKIRAKPGQRGVLVEALGGGTGAMPGNLLYLVAEDAADLDLIWVTEVWNSEASHRASLQLPAVQEAIRRGRPAIASFETVATMRPVSGLG